MTATDWNTTLYTRFRGLRLRPAIDLLAQVTDLPDGPVIDLGCGAGSVGGALRARFPDRTLIGVDGSPNMLAEAEATELYDTLTEADATDWTPSTPPALVFSNALANWLPDHGVLFPKWAGWLATGGAFAVQMPRQYFEPSHALIREVAHDLFPDRFPDTPFVPPVAEAADYADLLAPLGDVSAWETTYVQRLAPVSEGHPVRHFTQSTVMRPTLAKLDGAEQTRFLDAYDAALHEAYALRADGGVHFPFKRVFFVLNRHGDTE